MSKSANLLRETESECDRWRGRVAQWRLRYRVVCASRTATLQGAVHLPRRVFRGAAKMCGIRLLPLPHVACMRCAHLRTSQTC